MNFAFHLRFYYMHELIVLALDVSLCQVVVLC
jgi:hypothetical protein